LALYSWIASVQSIMLMATEFSFILLKLMLLVNCNLN
jgi:hypothetical protein